MVFPNTDLDIVVQAFLGADPTDAPGTWPAATDLSSRLLRKPIQIRRGRGNNQKTASASACTLWLDNTDGALTPLLASSTYYPDWDFGIPFRVMVTNVGVSPPYVRHAGFVADISAVMVPGTNGTNISAVRVTSAGVLRRISQGAVVKSALKRTILASAPEAYWPLEDDSDATSAASGTGGSSMATAGTVTFAAAADLAGSIQVAELTNGMLDGTLIGVSPTSWHVELIMKRAFGTASFGRVITSSPTFTLYRLFSPTAIGQPWQVVITTNGTTTASLIGGVAAANFESVYHHFAVTSEQVGSNVVSNMYIDGVFEATNTTAGTLAAPNEILANHTFTNFTISTFLGHVALGSGTTISSALAAMDAYAGEQAHVRIVRLCTEEGIPYSTTATESAECGVQSVADVVTLFQDAETVDHGMLIEDTNFGLDYRAMSQRYNLDPSITIDLATYRTTSGTQADVLTPVLNDARIRNEWTISRPEGSSATATDAAHIAKRGRYNDSATVNVENDARTFDEASWRVHEGTFEGLRYETLPLDVAANQ